MEVNKPREILFASFSKEDFADPLLNRFLTAAF